MAAKYGVGPSGESKAARFDTKRSSKYVGAPWKRSQPHSTADTARMPRRDLRRHLEVGRTPRSRASHCCGMQPVPAEVLDRVERRDDVDDNRVDARVDRPQLNWWMAHCACATSGVVMGAALASTFLRTSVWTSGDASARRRRASAARDLAGARASCRRRPSPRPGAPDRTGWPKRRPSPRSSGRGAPSAQARGARIGRRADSTVITPKPCLT